MEFIETSVFTERISKLREHTEFAILRMRVGSDGRAPVWARGKSEFARRWALDAAD